MQTQTGGADTKSYDLEAGKLKVDFIGEGGRIDPPQEFTDGENDPFIYGLLATKRS